MRKALFFLGVLSDSDIDWMISAGERREVPAGTVLIREGQPIDDIYVVLDGVVVVSVTSLGDRPIARLGSGEIVGEMSFVDSRPPSATVTVEEEAVVLAVPRVRIAAKLAEPAFAARFYHALSVFLANRLRRTVGRLGYGQADQRPDDASAEEDLDPELLEQVTLAGARFDWLLRRLRGA